MWWVAGKVRVHPAETGQWAPESWWHLRDVRDRPSA